MSPALVFPCVSQPEFMDSFAQEDKQSFDYIALYIVARLWKCGVESSGSHPVRSVMMRLWPASTPAFSLPWKNPRIGALGTSQCHALCIVARQWRTATWSLRSCTWRNSRRGFWHLNPPRFLNVDLNVAPRRQTPSDSMNSSSCSSCVECFDLLNSGGQEYKSELLTTHRIVLLLLSRRGQEHKSQLFTSRRMHWLFVEKKGSRTSVTVVRAASHALTFCWEERI